MAVSGSEWQVCELVGVYTGMNLTIRQLSNQEQTVLLDLLLRQRAVWEKAVERR